MIYGESLASLSSPLHLAALSLGHSSPDSIPIALFAVHSLTLLELAFPRPLHSYDKADIKLHREFLSFLSTKNWSGVKNVILLPALATATVGMR